MLISSIDLGRSVVKSPAPAPPPLVWTQQFWAGELLPLCVFSAGRKGGWTWPLARPRCFREPRPAVGIQSTFLSRPASLRSGRSCGEVGGGSLLSPQLSPRWAPGEGRAMAREPFAFLRKNAKGEKALDGGRQSSKNRDSSATWGENSARKETGLGREIWRPGASHCD